MTTKTKTIRIFDYAGGFAENKDAARQIREDYLLPVLKKSEIIVLDYEKVDSTTQSFTHALITEAIRVHGSDILDKIIFKNCNDSVRQIIEIVIQYMQQDLN